MSQWNPLKEEISGICPKKDLASPPLESKEQLGSGKSILQVNIFVEYKHTSRVQDFATNFYSPFWTYLPYNNFVQAA